MFPPILSCSSKIAVVRGCPTEEVVAFPPGSSRSRSSLVEEDQHLSSLRKRNIPENQSVVITETPPASYTPDDFYMKMQHSIILTKANFGLAAERFYLCPRRLIRGSSSSSGPVPLVDEPVPEEAVAREQGDMFCVPEKVSSIMSHSSLTHYSDGTQSSHKM